MVSACNQYIGVVLLYKMRFIFSSVHTATLANNICIRYFSGVDADILEA